MKKRRVQWISGVYVALVLFVLLFLPQLLVFPLAEDPFIPLGTILVWVGYIAITLFFLVSSKGLNPPSHLFLTGIRKAFLFTLLLAILWAPLVFWLSGNFAGNFQPQDTFRGSPRASRVFWILNYALACLPIALWLIQAVFVFLRGRKQPMDKT